MPSKKPGKITFKGKIDPRQSGDIGVVVHVYPRHEAYEVEFVTLALQTAAVVTAAADQIRPISKTRASHARKRAHG